MKNKNWKLGLIFLALIACGCDGSSRGSGQSTAREKKESVASSGVAQTESVNGVNPTEESESAVPGCQNPDEYDGYDLLHGAAALRLDFQGILPQFIKDDINGDWSQLTASDGVHLPTVRKWVFYIHKYGGFLVYDEARNRTDWIPFKPNSKIGFLSYFKSSPLQNRVAFASENRASTDSYGNIVVVDIEQRRVFQFESEWFKLPMTGSHASTFDEASSFTTLSPDGHLFATLMGAELQVLEVDTGKSRTFTNSELKNPYGLGPAKIWLESNLFFYDNNRIALLAKRHYDGGVSDNYSLPVELDLRDGQFRSSSIGGDNGTKTFGPSLKVEDCSGRKVLIQHWLFTDLIMRASENIMFTPAVIRLDGDFAVHVYDPVTKQTVYQTSALPYVAPSTGWSHRRVLVYKSRQKDKALPDTLGVWTYEYLDDKDTYERPGLSYKGIRVTRYDVSTGVTLQTTVPAIQANGTQYCNYIADRNGSGKIDCD